jgi:hypothetical protein
MAESKARSQNREPRDEGDRLRGGTEGGEAARLIDPNNSEGGTPAITSPAGGVHPERPSRAVPNTEAGQTETPLPLPDKRDLSAPGPVVNPP